MEMRSDRTGDGTHQTWELRIMREEAERMRHDDFNCGGLSEEKCLVEEFDGMEVILDDGPCVTHVSVGAACSLDPYVHHRRRPFVVDHAAKCSTAHGHYRHSYRLTPIGFNNGSRSQQIHTWVA
ncbi:hypothetical protein Ancab_013032 [Ancistrocladus abbreviatus]